MKADDIVAAFALPASAIRPTRIPKTVLNERGAATAAEVGFGVVCLSRPVLDDVVRSIESMR